MTTDKHDFWALLREAREALVRAENQMMAPPHQVPDVIQRIDAALAEGCPDCGHRYGQQEYCQGDGHAEHADSATPVVESDDLWWTPSSHRAKEGKYEMHVWRMSLKQWGWSTYAYQEREVGSGLCNTFDEAKSAAIAAARGMK